MDVNVLNTALVPIVTPLVVWLLSVIVPQLPRHFLPLAAAVVGPACDAILTLLQNFAGADAHMSPIAAIALGLAGVGVRELKANAPKMLGGT